MFAVRGINCNRTEAGEDRCRCGGFTGRVVKISGSSIKYESSTFSKPILSAYCVPRLLGTGDLKGVKSSLFP